MLHRIDPLMPAAAYNTYLIAVPLATHWRPATCEEVGCVQYLNGWASLIDETSELGQRQAHYIRHDRTRRHTEERTPDGLTRFTFEAGQKCYGASSHRRRLDRVERYAVRGGDWRGNPRGEFREHVRPEDWVEDFGEHQDRLKTVIERG